MDSRTKLVRITCKMDADLGKFKKKSAHLVSNLDQLNVYIKMSLTQLPGKTILSCYAAVTLHMKDSYN